MLRRATARKPDIDQLGMPLSTADGCPCEDEFRKDSLSSDQLSDQRLSPHIDPHNSQLPIGIELLDESETSSPTNDRVHIDVELDSAPDTHHDPDIDIDADLDVRSTEVCAAQSETASTISRAALSIGDKTEMDIRDHNPILTASRTQEQHHTSSIPSKPPTTNVRTQLRAAYVRELLLSSLSL